MSKWQRSATLKNNAKTPKVKTMTDNVTNELMFDTLKAIQAELASMRDDIRELRDRQNETHSAVLAVRRDQAQDAEVGVNLAARVDRLYDRMDRIERRLDLAE